MAPPPPQPHEGSAAQPPQLLQLSQVLQQARLKCDFLHSRKANRWPPQRFFLQQLLQAGAQPHDGSAAQPQEGAAAAQAGSAAQPHEGAAAQLLQLLQDFLQPQPKNLSCRCPSTWQ